MSKRLIYCQKLKKEAEGLTEAPLTGPLGLQIYENISEEAWQLWLHHQTMLINEYRLSLIDQNAKIFLAKEMENFLFGSGSDKPSGYVAI